jgi:hypothetical protein
MSEIIDFKPYLHAIRQHYEHWWEGEAGVAGEDNGEGEWVGFAVVVEDEVVGENAIRFCCAELG